MNAPPASAATLPRSGSVAENFSASWRRHDPLLSCLIELTRIHGRGMTADSLIAGLPLPEGLLTPSVFRRAAIRAGLASRISRRPLEAIRPELLPCILLLKHNDACLLLGFSPDGQKARVLFSESGQGEALIHLKRLKLQYSGHCIFARPRFRFDDRAPEIRNVAARHWFWGALADNWLLYRDVLLAAVLVNVAAIVIPFFSLNVYDRVIPNNATETLWTLSLGVLLIIGVDFSLRMARSKVLDLASKRVDITLSALIMERVLGIRLENRPTSAGSFASNLRAFESVRDFITSASITAFIDLPFAILFLILIFWLAPPVGIVIIVAIIFLVVLALSLQPRLQALTEVSQRAAAVRNSALIESLVGLETLKAQCAEGPMQRKWEQSVGYLAKIGADTRLLVARVSNGTTSVQQMVTVFSVIVGVYMIANTDLTMGGLIASNMLAARALAPFGQIAGLLTQYQSTILGLAGLDKVVNTPVERPETANFVRRESVRGEIEFEHVAYKYPGSDIEVLRDVSFRIRPGEHVGIIGKVGSGKSTLNRLILGLYQPTSGAIKIDGVDSRQLDPAELRKAIGYVPQDVVLFFGSLRDNIAMGMPYVEDYGILEAARLAGLEELVGNHPAGFDMLIGERGESLSGGQRQSVAIARAFIREPSLLLLDEPTSSMDFTSENTFKARLATYIKNRTMLLVTHRTSLMDLLDRLIVIDRGVIVADGPKAKVIQALRSGSVKRGG